MINGWNDLYCLFYKKMMKIRDEDLFIGKTNTDNATPLRYNLPIILNVICTVKAQYLLKEYASLYL